MTVPFALPPELAARFEVRRVLGQGSMGVVLLATDRELDRPVAVKLFRPTAPRPSLLQRFNREAQVTAQLNHPHVVQLFDHGILADGQAFILYEYVEGHDLLRVLATRGGTLPVAEVLNIGRLIAEALHSAHEIEIVHRDVKPANIVLRKDGAPVLCDFGLARALRGAGQTTKGRVVGTLAYMDPLLMEGGAADPTADQFSLAATLYTLLVGQPPITEENFSEVIASYGASLEVRLPETINQAVPGLESLLRRAMSGEREDRFPSLAAVASALEYLERELESTSSGEGALTEEIRSGRFPPGGTSSVIRPESRARIPLRRGPKAAPEKRRGVLGMGLGVTAWLGLLVWLSWLAAPGPAPRVTPAPTAKVAEVFQAPSEDPEVVEASRRLKEAHLSLLRWHLAEECPARLTDYIAADDQYEHLLRSLSLFADGQMGIDMESHAQALDRWLTALERHELESGSPGVSRRDPKLRAMVLELGTRQTWGLFKDLRDLENAILLNFTNVVPNQQILSYRAQTAYTWDTIRALYVDSIAHLARWAEGDLELTALAVRLGNLFSTEGRKQWHQRLLQMLESSGTTEDIVRYLSGTLWQVDISNFGEVYSCEEGAAKLKRTFPLVEQAGGLERPSRVPVLTHLLHVSLVRTAKTCGSISPRLQPSFRRLEDHFSGASLAEPEVEARRGIQQMAHYETRISEAFAPSPPDVLAHLQRLRERVSATP